MNRDQLLAHVEQEGIDFIQLEMLDPNAIGRGVVLAREYLARALDRGVNFSVTTMGVNLDAEFALPALGVEAGDFWAVANPESYTALPYLEHAGHVFCDLRDVAGRPWDGCPREALRRVDAAARRELGMVTLGFEQEGFLVTRGPDGRPKRLDNGHFFNFDILNTKHPFLRDLADCLRQMGIEPEKVRSENQFGQVELNVRYAAPLQAAERAWLFRQAFRNLAKRHGYIGTFMPKVFADAQGSGLHLHIGLSDPSGRDLFYDPADPHGLELSAAGRHFLGGLLAHAEALVALGSPSVNSYKRLLPGSWSPAHHGYAAGNRSALVRVIESRPNAPGGPTSKRLELRSPDGTCNPYFLATAVLAAGLDGVRRELEPGQDQSGHDLAALADTERERLGAAELPRTLDRALDALERDGLMREALGATLFDAFVGSKRSEFRNYHTSISDWEVEHYLEHF
jgi:glutamine synthetase